jgi:hypothetical protein
MPENTLYVEGSILDRFLRGEIFLEEVFYNEILLAVNKPVLNETINSVNAARITIGASIKILELKTQLILKGYYKNGIADGEIEGCEELIEQVEGFKFDALAIQSKVYVSESIGLHYLRNSTINPWGRVEAKLSKLVANKIDKPVAHAPQGDTIEDFNEIVDPRISAEIVSVSYLHSVIKGLHKAPRISYKSGLSNKDIDFLITPINCVGEPHHACLENGIRIIAVKENKTVLNDEMPKEFIIVNNYVEAAGLLMAYRAGIDVRSVRRPFFMQETLID